VRERAETGDTAARYLKPQQSQDLADSLSAVHNLRDGRPGVGDLVAAVVGHRAQERGGPPDEAGSLKRSGEVREALLKNGAPRLPEPTQSPSECWAPPVLAWEE